MISKTISANMTTEIVRRLFTGVIALKCLSFSDKLMKNKRNFKQKNIRDTIATQKTFLS